ncbi:MAG: hypothetical protein IKP31_02950 [Lachnospiraceae bacterium]|nr:hypothetical protein [Lachnospiraceae bacterium]
MEYIKKNFLLAVVVVLDLVITILSLILGCLMYTANCRATLQNTIYVEVTDLISNIDYGLHFGKSLESYYGMDKILGEALDDFSNIRAMYVVTDDEKVLFSAGEGVLTSEGAKLSVGDNIKDGKVFYCSYKLTDTARLITECDIGIYVIRWNRYYRHLAFISAAGFFVSAGIMILMWRNMKNQDRAYKFMIVVLILWIIIISSYVGYSAYYEYTSSIDQIYQTIENTVAKDIERVHNKGVTDAMITDIDEYLLGYSDNIREIDAIHYGENGLGFEMSVSYMRKIMVDYIMQTLLFLAFSSMILTEYQLFMSGIKSVDKEGADNV